MDACFNFLGISTDEAGMKSTGSRLKLGTHFLAVFWTLPDFMGYLYGMSGCATFDLCTVHHLLMIEIQELQSH